MSSRRFPGKVLAPFRGRPILWHVIDRAQRALPDAPCVVVTSDQASDDPLAAYVATLGVPCVRGPLDDVVARFQLAARAHPCEWILRICADSPLLDGDVLRAVVAARDPAVELVTTTAPRTFPKGQNAELVRTDALLALDDAALDAEDREHVTRWFHRHGKLRNVESGDPARASIDLAVDTIDDLHRLEASA